MTEIIIDDERIREKQSLLIKQYKEADSFICRYIDILDIISQKAIRNGRTYKAFEVYRTYASRLKGELENISEKIGYITDEYLSKVSEKDN